MKSNTFDIYLIPTTSLFDALRRTSIQISNFIICLHRVLTVRKKLQIVIIFYTYSYT